MRRPLTLAALAMALVSFSIKVNSQEIGHLETTDDPDAISSWVFFNCTKSGQLMICDVFQTLISHELRPDLRASDIETAMEGD